MVRRNGAYKTGTVIAWIVGIILILSGLTKFFDIALLEISFEAWQLTEWRTIIAIIEIVGGILIIPRQTTILGTLYLSAFFGGAIVAHLVADQLDFLLAPLVLLAAVWLIAYLRKPKLEKTYDKEYTQLNINP